MDIDDSIATYIVNFTIYIVTAGFFGGLSSLLVLRFAPYAAGSGIPELKAILGGFVLNSFISVKTLVLKVVGLILAVAAGLCLGQEGPMAHIGGAATAVFAPLFPKYNSNEAKVREIISSGCACGVAVAFGAPIGGVLFSLEELSSFFPHSTMWRAFFCTAIGALILKMLNPLGTGKLVVFQVSYTHGWKWVELPLFLLVGVVGGLLGQLFVKLNIKWIAYKRTTWIKRWAIIEVLFVSLLTAFLCFSNIFTRLPTTEALAALFASCDDQPGLCSEPPLQLLGSLLIALVLKLLLTSITNGIKVPAGMMVPCLAMGALFGRMVGVIFHQFYLLDARDNRLSLFAECEGSGNSCIEPGLYALLAAAAVLNGATGITVSLTVIFFELTGQADFIVPIMLAVVGSWSVGSGQHAKGLYDELIELNEYPYLDVKATNIKFKQAEAQSIMTRQLTCIPWSGTTLARLEALLTAAPFSGFPIVLGSDDEDITADPLVSGFVSRAQLEDLLQQAKAEHYEENTACFICPEDVARASASSERFLDLSEMIDRSPLQVADSTPLEVVCKMFQMLGMRFLLVTHHGRLRGIITKKDLIRYISMLTVHHPRTFKVVEPATISDSGLYRLCCERPATTEFGA